MVLKKTKLKPRPLKKTEPRSQSLEKESESSKEDLKGQIQQLQTALLIHSQKNNLRDQSEFNYQVLLVLESINVNLSGIKSNLKNIGMAIAKESPEEEEEDEDEEEEQDKDDQEEEDAEWED